MTDELCAAVRRPAPGSGLRLAAEGVLTPRQTAVVELLARGWTNREIADALGISLDGAKWHVAEVLSRLGAGSRVEVARWWRREAQAA